ncbi:hypothetical protein PUMCH_001611 [Australozyma saopauloensis]|uniref:Major facilitator superfamily (MFS) profile domain-containing protein n=1 Tax=Australozyma saopauloensis TaxID=291208 RepID=A0AAX4H6Y8_9ASCO|nr:hypothetical protein PUMCH_001611 [[Candida] saopauloensis]
MSASKMPPLQPETIKDSSTGTAGIVACEVAAESDGLISQSALKSHNYGSNSASNDAEDDEDDKAVLPKAQLRLLVASLFMAAFLAALDTTVVTTLLTVIASDLKSVERISWIATSYLLSCSAFQPLFGKLLDIFGRKLLLVICCALFAVGCCICVTNLLPWLVFGRFVTGCGGSGLTTLGTITLSDLIPLRQRGLYQGMANIFFGLGAASGGIVGGVVSDLLGWKYVFALQVPLAVLVGLAIHMYLVLPEGSPGLGAAGTEFSEKLKRVDFMGAFSLVSALMLLLAATSMGGKEFAYSLKTFIGMLLLSLALIVTFIYVETYVADEPIIPMAVMAERTVLSASLANWFYTMGVFTNLFYVPVFFQTVIGLSATQSGERIIPNFFALSLGSLLTGLYMLKTGRYYTLCVVIGLISTLGMLRLFYLDENATLWQQYTILVPQGLGYSSALTITLLALIASVPQKYQACTTSIQYTFRATGSTIGVSLASAIFEKVLREKLRGLIHEAIPDFEKAEKIIRKALETTTYVKHAPEIVQHAIKNSYNQACIAAFVFGAISLTLGFVSSLFMREHVLHKSIERDETE